MSAAGVRYVVALGGVVDPRGVCRWSPLFVKRPGALSLGASVCVDLSGARVFASLAAAERCAAAANYAGGCGCGRRRFRSSALVRDRGRRVCFVPFSVDPCRGCFALLGRVLELGGPVADRLRGLVAGVPFQAVCVESGRGDMAGAVVSLA